MNVPPGIKRVYFITVSGHAFCHISILVFSAILVPVSIEFGLSLTKLTGIGSLAFLLFGVGALPAGILTGIKNPKFMLKIFFLGVSVSCLFIGLSRSLTAFSIAFVSLGVFASSYHVAGSTLISQTIKKVGKSFGIHGVAGSAGITISPILASLLTQTWGWRSVYFTLAGIGFLYFLFLLTDSKIPEAGTTAPAQGKEGGATLLRFFLVLIAIMIINGFVYRAFMTIFPTYINSKFETGGGLKLVSGGFIASGILSVGMIGQYLGGFFSDRMDRLVLYTIILSVSSGALFLMGFFSGSALIAISVLFTLFFFPMQSIENSIISIAAPARFTSSIFGLKFILSFGVGSIGAFFSGFITDRWGSSYVFWIIAIFLAVSALSALLLKLLNSKNPVLR